MTEESVQVSHLIPLENLDSLREKLSKLNKISQKLELPPITVSFGEKMYRDFKTEQGDIKVPYILVKISGTFPRLPGYQFVAKLEKINDRNLFGVKNEIKEEWVHMKSFCDHCKSNRARKETYLVKEEETGRILQIGSSCIDQFIGSESLDSLALRASIFEIFEDRELTEKTSGQRNKVVFTEEFIATVIATTKKFGFVSKSQAEASLGLRPTALTAFNQLIPIFPQSERVDLTVSESDREKAQMAIAKIDAVLGELMNSSLGINIKTLCLSPELHFNNIHIAALLGKAAVRYDEESTKAKSPPFLGNYLGSVGEKISVWVRVEKVQAFESGFNGSMVNMIIMKDESGNTITTTTGGSFSPGVDSVIEIKGTIKAHKEYKGVKQTVLQRVSVIQCEVVEAVKRKLQDQPFTIVQSPGDSNFSVSLDSFVESIRLACQIPGVDYFTTNLFAVVKNEVVDLTEEKETSFVVEIISASSKKEIMQFKLRAKKDGNNMLCLSAQFVKKKV